MRQVWHLRFHFLIVFRNLLAKHCQSFISTLKHIYVLLQPVAKQKYGFDDSSTDGPSISNNLVQVNVYFDSLSEELISSNILYTVGALIISSRCLNCLLYFQGSSLMSGIGGVLSLYLGISIAMVFEIVEIFLDLFGNVLNWMSGKPLGRRNLIF